jgi:hypothetical protein
MESWIFSHRDTKPGNTGPGARGRGRGRATTAPGPGATHEIGSAGRGAERADRRKHRDTRRMR